MKSGFVAIVGRPNSGKSTFVNSLLGFKVSIVSRKPQTTMHQIKGIYNDEDSQIVFLDTPGFNTSEKKFSKNIRKIVLDSVQDADCVLYLMDGFREIGDEEMAIIETLRESGKKVVVAVNKVDAVKDIKPRIEEVSSLVEDFVDSEITPISGQKGLGFSNVIENLKNYLPEGEEFYPRDYYTDQDVNFRASEIVREKIFEYFKDEIPYNTEIVVDEVIEEKDMWKFYARIIVKKESQKGIIIGKGGRLIKRIGTSARKDLEEIFGKKVFLKLEVEVGI